MAKKYKYLFYFTINLFLLLSLSSCNYDKTVVTLGSEFDNTWSFNSASGYDFDENLVEVTNGVARLKPLDLEHSGLDFNNGTHVGTSLEINSKVLGINASNDLSKDIRTILPNKVSNLVGYWKVEKNWLDATNNNNDGLAAGTTTYSNDSKLGFYSGEFFNDNIFTDEISVPHSPSLELENNFSISFWIKSDSSLPEDWTRIITKATGLPVTSGEAGWLVSRNNNTNEILIRTDTVLEFNNNHYMNYPVLDNKFHHIVFVLDNGAITGYVDGVLRLSSSYTVDGDFTIPSEPLKFGGNGASNREFEGVLDELAIFNVSLTSLDVDELYKEQSKNYIELSSDWTPKWDNIVGYWKMDGNWQDSSGAGNHGLASGDAQHSPESKVGALSGLFDGAGDNVQITGPFSSAVSELSVGGWIKVKNFNFYSGINIRTPFISNWNSYSGGSQSGFMLSAFHTISNNRFTVSINDGVNSVALYTEPYSDADFETNFSGKWLHIATTYKSGEYIRIFLNGKMIAERVTGVPLVMSPETTTRLGSTSVNPGVLDGNLDDFAIWSAALSKIEISSIYNRQKQKYASHYDSEVIDLGNATSNWPDLSWSTSLPFGKELVGDFDNDGTPDSESSSDYSGLSGDLSNGLVGYWPFSKVTWNGTPGEVVDFSGNNNHGTRSGDAHTENFGRIGRSVRLDGDEGISISDSPSLSFGASEDFTLSAWIRTQNDAEDQSIFNHNWHYNFHMLANGKLQFYFSPSSGFCTINGDIQVDDGEWNHVVATISRNSACTTDELKLYVNGKLDTGAVISNSTENTDANFNPGAPLFIGYATANTRAIIGNLDESAIWKRALSNTEIQQLYRRGANRIKFQVKSCVDSSCNCKSYGAGGSETDCDGDTIANALDNDDEHRAEFIGPGGDGTTYYSELYNRNTTDVTFNCALNTTDDNIGVCVEDEITLTGSSKPTGPEFLNIDYTQFVNPSPNRYAQYRVIMEADENTACGGEPCLPELSSVSLNPSGSIKYASEYVEVRPNAPITFSRIANLTIVADSCASFRLAREGIQYYYDSGAWTPIATEADRSPASDLEDHILTFVNQFGPGELEVIGYLKSDPSGSTQCRIDEIDVGYK